MKRVSDIPDLRIKAVEEFLDARVSFGVAMQGLFANKATLPPLEQEMLDVLEKALKHVRIEISRALLVLEERHLGIVGSIVTLGVDTSESDPSDGPVPPEGSKGVCLGNRASFGTRKN